MMFEMVHVRARAQNNVLGLGPCPRALIIPRRETRLTLQASSVGDKGKKVRGGITPQTWRT